MLVLSRKLNQKVIAYVRGEPIAITIVGVSKDKVRLGFEGDREKAIFRREEIDDGQIPESNLGLAELPVTPSGEIA